MNRYRGAGRLLQIYWNYAVAKRARCPYPPYRVWVEPTNRCNLRCPLCPNSSLPESQLGMMEGGLFQKIIDEIAPYVHDINIHHRGESMLHPDLVSMIAYAAGRGISVRLHTNATLLDEGWADRLLRSGLDVISFSFDGLDAETYERYRKGAHFGDTLENILQFLKMKKELGLQRPMAVLEMMDLSGVDQRYSLQGKDEFLRRFDGLPLNRFVIKRPHNFGGNVRLSPREDCSPRSLTPCTIPWHSLVVLWNGDVVPCPQDFFGQMIIGKAAEQKLVDVFNSPKSVELRTNMIFRHVSALSPCASCDFIRRRAFLGIPVQSLRYLRS